MSECTVCTSACKEDNQKNSLCEECLALLKAPTLQNMMRQNAITAENKELKEKLDKLEFDHAIDKEERDGFKEMNKALSLKLALYEKVKEVGYDEIIRNEIAAREKVQEELAISEKALELICKDDEMFESGTVWKVTYNRYIDKAKETPCD